MQRWLPGNGLRILPILDNHDPSVDALLINVVKGVTTAPVVIDFITLGSFMILIETQLMNLIGTAYLNICIILRFIYTALLIYSDHFRQSLWLERLNNIDAVILARNSFYIL